MQAQPFEENPRGSLARPDTSDVPRLAWNASGVEAIDDAVETVPAPVMSEKQHVQSRASVTSSPQQRQRKKKTPAKALVSSRYLSNTTVCATDKKTNTKKPFHLYGWGNTRPVGKTAFLGSNYMKSKNTAAKSVSPPALLTETTNRSRSEDQIEAIVDNTEDYLQPSVFGPTTVGSMIHRTHKRPRLNMLENSLNPSFSSGTRRPVPPGAPTRTAQRAFARKTKKQNAVIDSMVRSAYDSAHKLQFQQYYDVC